MVVGGGLDWADVWARQEIFGIRYQVLGIGFGFQVLGFGPRTGFGWMAS
jgi:hypothetical protein